MLPGPVERRPRSQRAKAPRSYQPHPGSECWGARGLQAACKHKAPRPSERWGCSGRAGLGVRFSPRGESRAVVLAARLVFLRPGCAAPRPPWMKDELLEGRAGPHSLAFTQTCGPEAQDFGAWLTVPAGGPAEGCRTQGASDGPGASLGEPAGLALTGHPRFLPRISSAPRVRVLQPARRLHKVSLLRDRVITGAVWAECCQGASRPMHSCHLDPGDISLRREPGALPRAAPEPWGVGTP